VHLLAALYFWTAFAGSVPPLPKVPLDTFDAHVRDQVQEAYQKASANARDPAANGALGMLLYAYEQFEFAKPCFERARAFAPGDPRWTYYLGRTQASLGDHPHAVDSLRESLKSNPGYTPAELKLGESLSAAGRTEESLALFESVLARYPDSAAAHYGIGKIHAAQKQNGAAVRHLRKACDLFPQFGAAHFALALVYRDLNETAKAREHMAIYQRNKLDWPPTPDPLLAAIHDLKSGPHAHLRKGIFLAEKGDLQAAAEEHEQALRVDPKLVQAHIHLIRIYGKLGRSEQAEWHYRAATALDPNALDSYYNFGVFLTERNRNAEAAEAYRKVLELNPLHAEAHNNLGYLLLIEGKADEAARHYRSAIENRPNFRLAHFNLGRVLVHQGKIREAIDHFRQTLSPEDADTPRYMHGLAAAYARTGDRAGAAKYLQAARQKAAAFGQSEVLAAIERDLKLLEDAPTP
jgi:tetratricopeptide (TPR) repeat protein